MYVNFLSTYSDKKSCHISITLQTSIARFVSDSWASCCGKELRHRLFIVAAADGKRADADCKSQDEFDCFQRSSAECSSTRRRWDIDGDGRGWRAAAGARRHRPRTTAQRQWQRCGDDDVWRAADARRQPLLTAAGEQRRQLDARPRSSWCH